MKKNTKLLKQYLERQNAEKQTPTDKKTDLKLLNKYLTNKRLNNVLDND